MAEPLWKRNNNPGNIRDFKAGGFRTYGSLEEGMQAWKSLLNRRYFGRGLNTPKSILYTYAPPADNNNTSAYVDFVSKRMGITPDTVLDPTNQDQMADLASAMFKMETGHTFTPDEIKRAWGVPVTPTATQAPITSTPVAMPVAQPLTQEQQQSPLAWTQSNSWMKPLIQQAMAPALKYNPYLEQVINLLG